MNALTLALNTAESVHELALLNNEKLLGEKRWENAKEDVEKLVPLVAELLEENGFIKKDLTQLVVVRGPGSFTSLRVGIAFMNALAEGLEIPLHSLTTFELLAKKAALKSPLLIALHAGGLDMGLQLFNGPANAIQVGALAPLLAELPHSSLHAVAQLPEALMDEFRSIALEKNWKILAAHELQTLGESMLTTGITDLEKSPSTAPLYLKNAHITVSKDPWKNPSRLS